MQPCMSADMGAHKNKLKKKGAVPILATKHHKEHKLISQ
jgi:hypothetical protein